MEEFEGKLTCLGKNTLYVILYIYNLIYIYIIFSVTIQKEVVGIDKNGEEITKAISYRLHIIVMQKLWQVNSQVLLIILL